MATDPNPYASLHKIWKAFGDWQNIRHLPSTVKIVFCAFFFVSSTVIHPVVAPVRQPWARPGPSAVPDAFMADEI